MDQWLRVYSALAEDPSSVFSTHARQLTIHNCLQLQLLGDFDAS